MLAEISNAMVALHREHFGRGPGAAKSVFYDGIVVCVLTDVYTRVEKTLIAAGQDGHVRRTRMLQQEALQDDYKTRVAAITGKRVEAFLGVAHVNPDVAVEIFFVGGSDD